MAATVAEKPVGRVIHFYGHINVAVLALAAPLKVGETIHITGKGVDFQQLVGSMQVEHKNIKEAKAKQEIAMKVEQPVKDGCEVFRL